MFFTLILVSIATLFIWDHFHKKHAKELLKKSRIPMRPTWPIIGSAHLLRDITSENIMDFLLSTMKAMGSKTISCFMWHHCTVLEADPKNLESLFSSPVEIFKNNGNDKMSSWLGDGLLLSSGKKWHTRRKVMTPSFHFKILEEFVEVFDKQTSILMEKLKPYADGKTALDIAPIICSTALDIIGETTMGVEINSQMHPDVPYVQAVHNVTEITAKRIRGAFLRMDWLFKLCAYTLRKNMMKDIHIMKSFTINVIQKRRATLLRENDQGNLKLGRRMSLLDTLLLASVDGKPLSDEDICEEVQNFMFAGHDTTAVALAFTIYLLSRHPEVQEKVCQEVKEVAGDDLSRPATFKQLQEMKYMECVIKESLRLYPPVPFLSRYFKDDTEINDKILPGGTHLTIALFAVMRDADYFESPNDFIPDRFFGDNSLKICPYAFLPFSGGLRNCIGQKYAMVEMKSVLSTLLRHYELLHLGEKLRPAPSIIMRSKNGVQIGLKPRVVE